MKPHSSYKEVLEEKELLSKPTSSIPTIQKPATQLCLPSDTKEYFPASKPHVEVNSSIPIGTILPAGCNRWISPIPPTNFDFAARVQNELHKLDNGIPIFGQYEMSEALRAKERDEIEKEAILQIQRQCSHHSVRNGTMRINGSWYVGDICQDCDKMIDPFPSDEYRIQIAREREIQQTKDSLRSS